MEYLEFICEDNLIWSPLAATIGDHVLQQKSAQHRYQTRSSGINVTTHEEPPSHLKLWRLIDTVQNRRDLFIEEEIKTAEAFMKGGIRAAGGFAVEQLYKKALQQFYKEHEDFREKFLKKSSILSRPPNYLSPTKPDQDIAIIFCKEDPCLQEIRQIYQMKSDTPLPKMWTLNSYAHNIPRPLPSFVLGGTHEEYQAMAKQVLSDVTVAINRFLQEQTSNVSKREAFKY